jgi:two-component system response regulator DevR
MITVFIVDDHDLVRRGLAELIDEHPNLSVVGEATTAAEALERITVVRPNVAVIDIRLPDSSGINLCRDLLSRCEDLSCLILAPYADEQTMVDAILAGASGYVLKDIRNFELISALEDVGSGKSLLDNRAVEVLMARLRREAEQNELLRELSSTERTVLHLLGRGLTADEISNQLDLTTQTTAGHISLVLAKLGMDEREACVLGAELVQRPRLRPRTDGAPAADGSKKAPAADGSKRVPAADGSKRVPAADGSKRVPAADGSNKSDTEGAAPTIDA